MIPLKLVMTTAGLGRFTAAQTDAGIDLTVTQVGFTAAVFVAAPTLTALPSEFRRIGTVSGESLGDNVVHMTVQDEAAVTYTVRGFGLWLADGTLFATYSQEVPIVEKSAASMVALAIDIVFPEAGVDRIVFGDTNFLNPPATTGSKGVVELATRDEGLTGTDPLRVPPVSVVQAMIAAMFPAGFVSAWFGTLDTIPAGWAVCDGSIVDRADGKGKIQTPDLRGRVAVGVSPDHPFGSTFGSASATSATAGAHEHAAAVTIAASDTGITTSTQARDVDAGGSASGVLTRVTLTDPGHTHSATVTIEQDGDHAHTVDVMQPSLAIYYIMKV